CRRTANWRFFWRLSTARGTGRISAGVDTPRSLEASAARVFRQCRFCRAQFEAISGCTISRHSSAILVCGEEVPGCAYQATPADCSRVLRPGKSCAIVIGTNTQQLGKLFGKPPNEVEGLDELMIRLGASVDLNFLRRFERRITGLANTMRNEDVLLFAKS